MRGMVVGEGGHSSGVLLYKPNIPIKRNVQDKGVSFPKPLSERQA